MADAFVLFGRLEADTASFQNSLKQADAVLRNTGKTIITVENEAKALGQNTSVTARGFEKMRESVASANVRLLATKQAFEQGQVGAKQMASAIRNVETATDRLNSKLKDLTAAQKGGLGGALEGAILSRLGPAALITATTSALVAGGKSVIDYSSKLEQLRIGFEGLTGSSAAATQHLKELQDFASKTPFDFAEIADASRKFQALGFQTKEVIPILTDLGNILAGSGRIDALPEAAKALSDIKAKGKLAGQEIIQLANAGIGIRDVLAKQLGVSSEAVVELGEKGQISADMVFKAVHKLSEERFGDALAKQSATFGGAIENIEDKLRQTSATAFKPLFDKLSTLAQDLNKEISSQGDDFVKIGITIGEYIGKGMSQGIASAIESSPNLIYSHFKKLAEDLGKTLQTALEGATVAGSLIPTGPLKALSRDLVDAIAKQLGATQEQINQAHKSFDSFSFFGNKKSNASPDGNFDPLDPSSFVDTFSKFLPKIEETGKAIDDALAPKDDTALKQAIEDAKKAADEMAAFKKAVEDANKKLDEMQKSALSAVDAIASRNTNPFVKVFNEAAKALESLKENTKGFTSGVVDSLKAAVQQANALALSAARLDAGQAGIEAGLGAAAFRNPTKLDLSKQLGGDLAEFQRISNSTNPDVIRRFQQRAKEIANFDENQKKVEAGTQLDFLLNKMRGADEGQQALIDKRIQALGSQFGPDTFDPSKREAIAQAYDREQVRQTKAETDAVKFYNGEMDWQKQIINEITGKKKQVGEAQTKDQLEITFKDESGKVGRVTTGTPKDVDLKYGTVAGPGGLSSF